MENKKLTQNVFGTRLLLVLLVTFMLVGMVSADECTGQDCGANMSIYVESPTCEQVLITYTGIASTNVNLGYSSMQQDVLDTVANFFVLAPVIGTIMAVIILVGVIFLLVVYVLKIKNNNSTSFNG